MVFIVLVIVSVVPVVVVFATILAAGLTTAYVLAGTFSSVGSRILVWGSLLLVTASIAVPLTDFVMDRLPDLRTTGDGGVGMANNLSCQIAASLLTPAVTFLLIALLANFVREKTVAE